MLSGILYPDANQHMRQCERCTSHYRARATVQSSLRKLAMASPNRPSAACDCAVMDSFRTLQRRRATDRQTETAQGKRVFSFPERSVQERGRSFPGRNLSSAWTSRTWWSGAAAAGLLFAVMGSAVHLWYGVPKVNTPSVAAAPTAEAAVLQVAPVRIASVPSVTLRHRSPRRTANAAPPELALRSSAPLPKQPQLEAKAAPERRVIPYDPDFNYDSTPVTQVSAGVSPVMQLASTGAASSVAQSASSTWPGYSNLMYCDPVVCSGPMQVVHIRVPVGQVRPNVGESMGNAFVNAEVVVGPDGVARAIRVAN